MSAAPPRRRVMRCVAPLLALGLAWLPALAGCQSSSPAPKATTFEATAIDRNAGYALLHTLVTKNQDVDKLLILKRVTPESEKLIKAIAALCKDITVHLAQFAQGDATLGLDRHGLPVFEQQTRQAIEATTTKRLLLSGGDKLEVALLHSQAQSMDYLSHLALQLAEKDNIPTRATYLREASQRADELFKQVMARFAVAHQAEKQD